jgi:CSLREA domain-containing protein
MVHVPFRAVAVIGSLIAAAALLQSCAPPGDLIVTKFSDTNDGVCNADCSLREAVAVANARPGKDTIRTARAVLSRPGPGEDANATGDLDITDDLVIESNGEFEAVIHANRIDRAIDVHSGALELRRIRIEAGVAGDDTGGGIRSRGHLLLVDVVMFGNAARTGGAIDSSDLGVSPSLTLLRTTLESNWVGEDGGGIFSNGALRIEESLISDNSSGGGAGAGVLTRGDAVIRNSVIRGNSTPDCGGGIASGGTLEVRNSTIEFNLADAGAGISNGATLTVVGGTIRGNRSDESGGGIANVGLRSSVLVDGTGIVANIADRNNDPDVDGCIIGAEEGGGLFNSPNNQGTFALRNATVAYNDDYSGGAPDCFGTFLDRGGNVIGDETGCTLVT